MDSNIEEYISNIYDDVIKGIKRHGRSNKIEESYQARIDKFNSETKYVIDQINTNAVKTATIIYNEFFRNAEDRQLKISLGYDNNRDKVPQAKKSYWLRCGYRYQYVEKAGVRQEKSVSSSMEILQPSITLNIEEMDTNNSTYHPIEKPQTFFNEAKLTAIALSIRFALLDTTMASNGRFLALDDMLISLDMSNRMKVVKYLLKVVVNKYKIYLFTHDKYFYEYFKHKSKRSSSQWIYREIYMQDEKEPFLRESKTYLDNADFYIKQHEYEIAGNFLRKEAESFCKEFLPKRQHFSADYSLLDLCGLIGNCKRFAENSGIADLSLFEELDDQRKFILNPASHDSYDVVKFEDEVKKCFNTLTMLRKISFRSIFKKGQVVRFALRTPVPNVSEYKFEITICDDFRLIKQDSHSPVISKGMINYTVTTNGTKGPVQSVCTTLKKFFEKNYSKSDKSNSSDFWDSIIDVSTGNTIRTLI